MKNLMLLFLMSCATDVGIIKRYDTPIDTGENITIDTSSNIETGIDTENQQIEGTVGLIKWELEQVACPPCMGLSQEITVDFYADFHENIEF